MAKRARQSDGSRRSSDTVFQQALAVVDERLCGNNSAQNHRSIRMSNEASNQNECSGGKRSCSSFFLLRVGAMTILLGNILRFDSTVLVHRHSGNMAVSRDLLKMTIQPYRLETSKRRGDLACQLMGSAQDIQSCYAAERVNALPTGCRTIQTWEDVQRCLTGRLGNLHNRTWIRQVHVIGERHSGTKFVTSELQQCFRRNEQFKVHRDFVRGKHWFQPTDEIELPNNSTDFRESLIVVVMRDPVEWMAAMWQYPYHSPSHLEGFDAAQKASVVPLPWPDFVHRPWTTTRTESDARILRDTHHYSNNSVCREGFLPHQVVPCQSEPLEWTELWHIPERRWRGFEPIYEMRPREGTPYDHLLQLRSDKIVNWVLELPMLLQIGGLVVVRYEDLLLRGTEFLLQQVANILAMEDGNEIEIPSLPAECKPALPQPERIGRRQIPDDFRKWIQQNVNAETERLINYDG